MFLIRAGACLGQIKKTTKIFAISLKHLHIFAKKNGNLCIFEINTDLKQM